MNDEDISKLINTYAVAMYAAVNFTKFDENPGKNKRLKSKIEKMLYKISLGKTSINDKWKTLASIKKMLDKITIRQDHFIQSSDVHKYLEKNSSSRNTVYSEISSIVWDICMDPLKTITEYAEKYITEIQRKQMLAEREEEKKAKAKEQEERKSNDLNRTSNHSSIETSRSTYTYNEPKKPRKEYYSEDNIKRIADDLLDSNKDYSYFEESKIEDLIRSCAKTDGKEEASYLYSDYDGQAAIKTMYKFFKYSDKKRKPSDITSEYEKMVKMGTLASEIAFNNLLAPRRIYSTALNMLINRFQPNQALNRYAGARTRWIKKYKHLNNKNKEIVDSIAKSKDEYRKMFNIHGTTGLDIATVDDIKALVNKRVREYILKNNPFYHMDSIGNKNDLNMDYKGKFERMVQYMSLEEIASLYHSVISKKEELNRYSKAIIKDENELKLFNENEKQKEANFQVFVANVISNRLVDHFDVNDDKEMEQHYRDIVSICREVLGEEPKSSYYQSKTKTVSKEYSKQRVETVKAIKSAERRYYGMTKFQRVVAILVNRKLNRLRGKELLNERQLNQVNNMFRR